MGWRLYSGNASHLKAHVHVHVHVLVSEGAWMISQSLLNGFVSAAASILGFGAGNEAIQLQRGEYH